MWNRANAYNTPEAQMQRFKQAGLNPKLIYGQSNMSTATLPKFQAPQYDYNPPVAVDLPAILSSYQDFRLKQAQIDNVKKQNELKDIAILSARTQVPFTTFGPRAEDGEIQSMETTIMPSWLAQSHAKARKMWADSQRAGTQASYQDSASREALRKIDREIALMNSRKDLLDKQTEFYYSDQIAKWVGVGGNLFRSLGGMFRKGSSGGKAIAQPAGKKPIYNSPSFWEQLPRKKFQ